MDWFTSPGHCARPYPNAAERYARNPHSRSLRPPPLAAQLHTHCPLLQGAAAGADGHGAEAAHGIWKWLGARLLRPLFLFTMNTAIPSPARLSAMRGGVRGALCGHSAPGAVRPVPLNASFSFQTFQARRVVGILNDQGTRRGKAPGRQGKDATCTEKEQTAKQS